MKKLRHFHPTYWGKSDVVLENFDSINVEERMLQEKRGNRRYHTSPTQCNPTTPFSADKPHRLRPEIFTILVSLAWHKEWSLLLHDIIGDWMIPLAAKIANAFEWTGPDNSQKLPVPLGGPAPRLTHGSFGPPESSSETVSQSVQPFFHSSP